MADGLECDGRVDNKIAGKDFDADGVPYPADCNDDEPLGNPSVPEAPGNQVDDNCNGEVDEKSCDDEASDSSASAFAKAIEVCTGLVDASFPKGDVLSRGIRTKFGGAFTPRAGSKMVMISTGRAKDLYDDPAFNPQLNTGESTFRTNDSPPIYTPARCATRSREPAAKDLSELELTLTVPATAKSFSFSFTFFSGEYPEFVCT